MKSGTLKYYKDYNKQIGREKIIVGTGTVFTDEDSSKIYLWETLPHTNEKSNLIFKNFVSIAADCKFIMGGNHHHDWICQSLLLPFSDIKEDEIESSGDIIIGNDVWIGYNSVILSGTEIPDGCVIGANTVVKGYNFKPYDIIIGNPAKSIKKRFDEETINTLLEIKWWDWDIEDIKKYSDILKSNDFKKLKEINENHRNNNRFKGE